MKTEVLWPQYSLFRLTNWLVFVNFLEKLCIYNKKRRVQMKERKKNLSIHVHIHLQRSSFSSPLTKIHANWHDVRRHEVESIGLELFAPEANVNRASAIKSNCMVMKIPNFTFVYFRRLLWLLSAIIGGRIHWFGCSYDVICMSGYQVSIFRSSKTHKRWWYDDECGLVSYGGRTVPKIERLRT